MNIESCPSCWLTLRQLAKTIVNDVDVRILAGCMHLQSCKAVDTACMSSTDMSKAAIISACANPDLLAEKITRSLAMLMTRLLKVSLFGRVGESPLAIAT